MTEPTVVNGDSPGEGPIGGSSPQVSTLAEIYGRLGDSVPDPVAAAARHVELGRVRRPDTACVAVRRDDALGATVQIVTDDMPLLVEAVLALLARVEVSAGVLVHPVLAAHRTADGVLEELGTDVVAATPGAAESWMHLQLHPPVGDEALERIERGLGRVLGDVRQVVADSEGMYERQRALADELTALVSDPPPGYTVEDLNEAANLLRWFTRGHLTVLGHRRYEFVPEADGGMRAEAVPGTGRGVLRTDPDGTADGDPLDLPAALGRDRRPLLVLTQGALPATVHRSIYPYFVGVTRLDARGTAVGEDRFLGVLTVTALHDNILDIPLLARRVREVIARAGVDVDSYTGQAMLEIMQTVPRAELFSMDADTLYETVTSVVELRRQVRLFVRADTYGRYVSCLVYLPRDRYTTKVRVAIQDTLLEEFGGGALDYTTRVSERDLALLHVTIRFPEREGRFVDVSEERRSRIQAQLAELVRNWTDRLTAAATTRPALEPALVQRYAESAPEAYKEDFDAERAASDLLRLEALDSGDIDTYLYRPESDDARLLRFTLYVAEETVTLGRILPVLQSLGVEVVDERPYRLTRADGTECWIYDFGLRLPGDIDPDVLETDPMLASRVTDTFTAAWCGRIETDRFNQLVLRAGLTWRQVLILRAYVKYLRQTGFPYSQDNVEEVLLDAPETAVLLVDLFEARFDPDAASPEREREAGDELAARIESVESLATDRILRALLSLICATLRTNHFVDTDGDRVLSLKFEPRAIAELPEPKPAFEVFVYAPDVEGVHMRFGPVARGGLRWSDRREDFRTEVLGLVKAQAVKNAVIVPVGAKGGFVVKHPPAPTGDAEADRRAVRERGEHSYRRFIAGLLDITDNLDTARDETLPPPRVVRHDPADPYLVVAADKGTATFSDLANSVAEEYDFWLGDAFASGGSAGYDHKAMGITARGAWKSVERHFRELDLDTETDDFTVVGIGDMSGDVFGNGMLLSPRIRLVAAFDHRHIFLDPDPDPERTFAERRRLFELPRSSWADYDRDLIGAGGGVWERTAKSVPIGPEIRAALGLGENVTRLSPPELIRAILCAPVDLLWNGGIGTYIKASTESHSDVGDKANDAVRVDAVDVRARVVGEGGNLGVTQRGRVEFALGGGKINTDAIDNSAGVDSSDREVNIKVLLDAAVGAGDLDIEDRNPLLESMTEDVVDLVLADNIRQNDVLGLERAAATQLLGVHRRLIAALEVDRGLDRDLEALPDDSELDRREAEGSGLTSPELSQLLAHVKLALVDDLLETDLPSGETFASILPTYFPPALRERFHSAIMVHPLRRQIVATMLVNETVDNSGPTFAYRLAEETGASTTDAIRAYKAVTEIFGLPAIWDEIRAAGLPSGIEDDLLLESRRVLDRAARKLVMGRPQPLAVGAEISRYRDPFARLAPHVTDWMQGHHVEDFDRRTRPLADRGAPDELIRKVFLLLDQFPLLDVIDVADITDREDTEVAALYFALDALLGVDRLLTAVSALERGDRWHSLARLALRDDLYGSLRSLVLDVLAESEPGESPKEMIADWEASNASRLERSRAALEEIFASGSLDLATLSVAAQQIRSMVRTGASDRR